MTLLDCLSTLPEPYKSKAVRNAKKTRPAELRRKVLRLPCESVPYALKNAFSWGSSPEGRDYWEGLYETLTKAE